MRGAVIAVCTFSDRKNRRVHLQKATIEARKQQNESWLTNKKKQKKNVYEESKR